MCELCNPTAPASLLEEDQVKAAEARRVNAARLTVADEMRRARVRVAALNAVERGLTWLSENGPEGFLSTLIAERYRLDIANPYRCVAGILWADKAGETYYEDGWDEVWVDDPDDEYNGGYYDEVFVERTLTYEDGWTYFTQNFPDEDGGSFGFTGFYDSEARDFVGTGDLTEAWLSVLNKLV